MSGIAWTLVLRWLAKAVSWTATLYVARVLSPADFGVMAMATVPIGLARLIGDFGIEAILVQNRAPGQSQLAALASTTLVLAGALAALFVALARPISWYFREPAVAGIVVVLSLTFVTYTLQLLLRALLQRDLRSPARISRGPAGGRLANDRFTRGLVRLHLARFHPRVARARQGLPPGLRIRDELRLVAGD